MARAGILGTLLLGAGTGAAEIYRCPDASGALSYTSDPRGCPGAEPVPLDADRVVRSPTPAKPAVPSAAAPIDASRLADLLPSAPRGWEPTNEPVATERDPALRAHGLLASVARHYGRASGAVTEVCSVEIWSFARADQAQSALTALELPRGWRKVSGTLLVMARGVRLERHVGTRFGMVPGCRQLAESVEGRARAASGGPASTR